jgi:hypothetical protein
MPRSIFDWSNIPMALRFAHAMNDAKRQAVEKYSRKKQFAWGEGNKAKTAGPPACRKALK